MEVFECQSAVLSCSFTPFSPHVIVGGTYSGQVVLWDCREAKRTPVQRSAINSKCHTHPVFCLTIVGSKNAHSLVTASTDGKLCEWDMDTLNEPQQSRELKSGTGTHGVAGTAFAFPAGGVNEFVLGAEDGGLFMGR
jgi:dynein intermediate chain